MPIARPSVQTKVKFEMTNSQQEIMVILVPTNRPSIQNKVKFEVTTVQGEIKVILVPKDRSSIRVITKLSNSEQSEHIII